MHYIRSVIDKETRVNTAVQPPAIDVDVSVDIDDDTLDNIIGIDTLDNFIGKVSPRQVDLIVDVLDDAGLL